MAVERKKCSRCEKGRALTRYVGTRGSVCDTCRRETRRTNARKAHLMNTYGITPAEYETILTKQDGHCAGCGEARPYNLAVDHDHSLELKLLSGGLDGRRATRRSVRALLCKRCNKVLRDVRDSAQVLRKLADVLDMPPARGVLR